MLLSFSPAVFHHISHPYLAMSRRFSARLLFLLILLLPVADFPLRADDTREEIEHISSRFNLDSIAAWGKFPRFCVRTYRWGDKFFNNFDSLYVKSTGTRFNVKLLNEYWTNSYMFSFPADDNARMILRSDATNSLGLWVSYMAVSLGYNVNLSKIHNPGYKSAQKFNFQFSCALFTAELYSIWNKAPVTLERFYKDGHPTLRPNFHFDGLNSRTFGINVYYYFNNKRYSMAATSNFGKIQRRSQGSPVAAFAWWEQSCRYDFSTIPDEIRLELPDSWRDDPYEASLRNYTLSGGYAYNWVLGRHWTIGVLEAPSIGLRFGRINHAPAHTTFTAFNKFTLSTVYNRGHLFAGIYGIAMTNLLYARKYSIYSSYYSITATVGYRFNLW